MDVRRKGTPGRAPEYELLAPVRGARVLVVDDNELNLEIAAELIRGGGLVVETAASGAVALEKLSTTRFDLVFMDMQMPAMDGLAAAAAIRRQPGCADLPIVAMTANAMPADVARCASAGMNDHLAKPLDPDRLWQLLLQWIPRGTRDRGNGPPAVPARRRAGPPADLDGTPGLDLAVGLRNVAGDGALLVTMLGMFVAAHRGDAAAIRRDVERGDRAGATRRAHTLKGLAATLGALELRDRARELEESLDGADDRGDTARALEAFGASLAELVSAVEAKLAAPAPPADRHASRRRGPGPAADGH